MRFGNSTPRILIGVNNFVFTMLKKYKNSMQLIVLRRFFWNILMKKSGGFSKFLYYLTMHLILFSNELGFPPQ